MRHNKYVSKERVTGVTDMILSVQTPPARPHMVHHLCEGKGLKMNTSPDAYLGVCVIVAIEKW